MIASNAFIIREMEEAAKERVKFNIAKNLLDILDDETISATTGLSIEEVKELRNKNNR